MNTAAQYKSGALAEVIHGTHITARAWSSESAYRYCEQIARSHYENFPVGSLLVPKPLRKHFHSIYAFARTADDLADEGYREGHSEGERLRLLEEWRALLRESFEGRVAHPIFIALSETCAQFGLPGELFEDLISAFIQDVTVRRYESFDELMDYCRRSANPIGRLILLLFGHRDNQLHEWADSICTALQLTNHWQDVAIDLDKDRIYIPACDLERFDLTVEDLQSRRSTEGFRRLMQMEVARARALFEQGKPLCVSVPGRLGLELRAVWLGGTRILDSLEKNGYDVFRRRPTIGFVGKLYILASGMRKGAFRRRLKADS
ncbi:MAG: squalene synthase HpnC [Blastocatellia bacterium]|nr:squalene synthase HpnC [Blastocatellia bacterium]